MNRNFLQGLTFLLAILTFSSISAQSVFQSYPDLGSSQVYSLDQTATGFNIGLLSQSNNGSLIQKTATTGPTGLLLNSVNVDFIEGQPIKKLSDGTYIRAINDAANGEMLFEKVDIEGNVINVVYFAYTQGNVAQFTAVDEYANGDVFVSYYHGNVPTIGNLPEQRTVVYAKINLIEGTVTWAYEFLSLNPVQFAALHTAEVAPDGSVFAALSEHFPQNPEHNVVKISPQGMLLWVTGVSTEIGRPAQFAPTADGGVWFIFDQDINYVQKINIEGVSVGGVPLDYQLQGVAKPLAIAPTPTSGVLVAGNVQPVGITQPQMYTAIIGADLQITQTNILTALPNLAKPRRGIALASGGYAFTGAFGAQTTTLNDTQSFLVTLDANGNYVTAPQCAISATLVSKLCTNNNTPSNPADDQFFVTMNVTKTGPCGTTYKVTGQTPSSNYGVTSTSYGPFPIAAGNANLVIYDVANPSSTTTLVVTPPATCSNVAPCSISATLASNTCSDNGTPSNSTDDQFYVTINATKTGSCGSTFKVTGQSATGSYGTNSPSFGPYAIAAGNATLNIYDVSNPSSTTTLVVNPPATCSNTSNCNISASVVTKVCNDNGTSSNPADDKFYVTINVSKTGNCGSGYQVAGQTAQGSYSSTSPSYGPFNISAGNTTLNISDIGTPSITTTLVVTPPATCSNVVPCSIAATLANKTCNDNGTPSNPADDLFYVTINATKTGNCGTTFKVTGQTPTGSYGTTSPSFGPYSIAAGNVTLSIYDVNNPTSTTSLIVTPPATCSNVVPCSIAATLANKTCNDNGTPSNPADDLFYVTINATKTGNCGTTFKVTGQTPTGSYGTTSPSFGPYPIASGNVTLSIYDVNNPTSTTSLIVTPPATCSNVVPCSIAATLANKTCNDNGTPSNPADDLFYVTINATKTGNCGTTFKVTGQTPTGSYGTTSPSFGPYPIASGNVTLNIYDVTNPTSITTLLVTPPATCSNQIGTGIDLSLTLTQSTNTPAIWNSYTILATVTNAGPATATGVKVKLAKPTTGVAYTGGSESTTTFGTFNPYGDEIWTIGSIAAGSTATLTVSYFLTQATAPSTYGQVTAHNEVDLDSQPNNGTPPAVNQDDEASTNATPASCAIAATLVTKTCNNNNTTTNSADDVFYVTINVTKTGSCGTTYKVNGQTANGTYGTTSPSYGPYSIAAGNATLTISDLSNPSATTTLVVTPPATCSNTCAIAATLVNKTCNNNNTPSNPADDQFYVTINVTKTGSCGTTYKVNGQTANGTYGSTSPSYGPYSIAAGNATLTISDVSNPSSTTTLVVTPPATCSNTCAIAATLVNKTCNNNNTPSNPADDQFYVTINVTKTGSCGTTYKVNGQTANGTYGTTSPSYGPYSIAAGNATLTISDVSNPSSTTTLVVTPPATCSNTCAIAATLVNKTCNNNNTPSNPADDQFYVTLNVTQNGNCGTTYKVNGQTANGTYGTTSPSYGPYSIAAGNATLTISDLSNTSSTTTLVVTPPATCSTVTGTNIDLSLSLTQNPTIPAIYTIYSTTATVTNSGSATATGVKVKFNKPVLGVAYDGGNEYTTSLGTFSPYLDEVWNIGNIPAGSSATLTVHYFLTLASAPVAYAQVIAHNEPDSDSQPNNGIAPIVSQDDEASTAGSTGTACPATTITGVTVTANQATLNWTAVAGAMTTNGYLVTISSTLAGFPQSFVSSTNTLTLTSLAAGNYTATVKALCSLPSNYSAASPTSTFIVNPNTGCSVIIAGVPGICDNNNTTTDATDDKFNLAVTANVVWIGTTVSNQPVQLTINGSTGISNLSLNIISLLPYAVNGVITIQACVVGQPTCCTNFTFTLPTSCSNGGVVNACSNIAITPSNGSLIISGAVAPHMLVKVLKPDWSEAYNCFGDCAMPVILNNLVPGNYYVEVKLLGEAYDSICQVIQTVSVSNNGAGGLQTASQKGSGITIKHFYPNPVDYWAQLVIHAETEQVVPIRITDMLGQLIFEQETKLVLGDQEIGLILDANTLEGNYILSIGNDADVDRHRITILHR
jgi:Domain of unknown function DUF11/LVIVD repeat